jgi:hypothetical protein
MLQVPSVTTESKALRRLCLRIQQHFVYRTLLRLARPRLYNARATRPSIHGGNRADLFNRSNGFLPCPPPSPPSLSQSLKSSRKPIIVYGELRSCHPSGRRGWRTSCSASRRHLIRPSPPRAATLLLRSLTPTGSQEIRSCSATLCHPYQGTFSWASPLP